MSVFDFMIAVFIFIFILPLVPLLFNKEESESNFEVFFGTIFLSVAFSLISGGISFASTMIPEEVNIVVKEYLCKADESEIDNKDLINIFSKQEDRVKLLDIDIFNLPKTTSKQINMRIKVGNGVYRIHEVTYLISNDEDGIYVYEL